MVTKFEKGFHPLNKVESSEIPDMSVNLALPDFVPQDRIHLHVRRIQTMKNLGGIRHLQVVGRSGDVSRYTPGLAGMNLDSSGIAGVTGAAEMVPTYSVELDDPFGNQTNLSAFRWTDARVVVNLSEIQERMKAREEPVRSTGAWARELNGAVNSGIAKAGLRHLLVNSPVSEWRDLSWTTAMSTGGSLVTDAFLVDGGSPLQTTILLTTFNVIGHTIANIAEVMMYYVNGGNESFRGSLINGPQFDRAAALYTMSNVTKSVRAS